MKKVKDSQFGNTYGNLALWQEETTGEFFLEMDDCYGPDQWGPLTAKQVEAFHTLCEVERS